MARSSKAGGRKGAATPSKARTAKGRDPKNRSQKVPGSGKKVSPTKPSIGELRKQIGGQARELEEVRQQQAASSSVLHIIGASPGALTPVFQAIVKNAVELCGARFGAVFKMEGDLLHLAAHNFEETQRLMLEELYPMPPNRGHVSGRAILTRSTVQIPDINADEDYRGNDAEKSGFRSLLATPLLKGDQAIGVIVIYKAEPGAFPTRQLALLQNFAAQGGHRHRERTAFQRDAGGAGTADGDGRHPEGDRQIAFRRATRVRGHCGKIESVDRKPIDRSLQHYWGHAVPDGVHAKHSRG